eukprot:5140715-Prymnesium_polylepis.1
MQAVERPQKDEDGHIFSPKIREQQEEVNTLYSQVPELANKGKAEYEKVFAAGHAQWEAGGTQTALECFGAAYVMARELSYRLGEAIALERAALCYRALAEHSRALTMFAGAVRLYGAEVDGAGVVSALSNLGQTHADLGDLVEASKALEQSRLAASRLGDGRLELGVLVKGAMVELRRGRPAEALRLLGQALGFACLLYTSPSPRDAHES